MRKKNGNLPSLSYQQRNRLSGSVQNLPKCKDQVDDMVQLESKLSHLMMGIRTNLKPIAQETRLHEFRDQYTDTLPSRSNANQSDTQRRFPETQERNSDFPIRRVNSMEKISSKLK